MVISQAQENGLVVNASTSSYSSTLYLRDVVGSNSARIRFMSGNGLNFIDNNDIVKARIDSSGNVGIGTASPGRLLQVSKSTASGSTATIPGILVSNTSTTQGDGSTTFNYAIIDVDAGNGAVRNRIGSNYDSTGNVGFIGTETNHQVWITTNGSPRITISNSGAIRFNTYGAGTLTTDASGNITAASDERIKSNIRPFPRGLAEILAINPILHGYTEESGLDQSRDDYAGFSAQQVQPLIPEAIGENANGMLSFSDRPVMAALVNAMKELNANLVAQVAALSQRLAALEAK
jgi:hypothetical protein